MNLIWTCALHIILLVPKNLVFLICDSHRKWGFALMSSNNLVLMICISALNLCIAFNLNLKKNLVSLICESHLSWGITNFMVVPNNFLRINCISSEMSSSCLVPMIYESHLNLCISYNLRSSKKDFVSEFWISFEMRHYKFLCGSKKIC